MQKEKQKEEKMPTSGALFLVFDYTYISFDIKCRHILMGIWRSWLEMLDF